MSRLCVCMLLSALFAALSPLAAGVHTLRWDAGSVSSGMYFLRVATGSWIETRKMPIYR